jgi:hypothetical protein
MHGQAIVGQKASMVERIVKGYLEWCYRFHNISLQTRLCTESHLGTISWIFLCYFFVLRSMYSEGKRCAEICWKTTAQLLNIPKLKKEAIR